MNRALLQELRYLEELLHTNEVRKNPKKADALLHADFRECGRSGRIYDRDEILAEFIGEKMLPKIHGREYALSLLADGVAMLTYVSMHEDEKGDFHRRTLRSSIWLREGNCWKMRFHQGTPVEVE